MTASHSFFFLPSGDRLDHAQATAFAKKQFELTMNFLSISILLSALTLSHGFHHATSFHQSFRSNHQQQPSQNNHHWQHHSLSSLGLTSRHEESSNDDAAASMQQSRRSVLSSAAAATIGAVCTATTTSPTAALAATDENDFASIQARASKIQSDLGQDSSGATSTNRSDKTAYDFSLPIQGKDTLLTDIIKQQSISSSQDQSSSSGVKAIVVVNIKQDDPIARKTIPELISLAAKYGRGDNPQLAIIISPTDQGYYEPDTSQLIRLKLASEYGYGINPSTIITDKVNLLGTGAHPFWRWLQSNCRTPAGVGRIEGNFEKFLIDARTGQPLRRYPRKYSPLSMEDDILATLQGRPLPPARANWQEEWRESATDAKTNTYRFEKGLNYFDQ
ncbi:hypothetical protein MPSEU_000853800 [Mayamaea pseudoterrestris]|nr:hypothetical protein MPSEU_000853800 [Mayamaea pseudoterrestris]